MAAGNSLQDNGTPMQSLKVSEKSKKIKDVQARKVLENPSTSQMIPVVVWSFRLYGIELCTTKLTNTRCIILTCLKTVTGIFLAATLIIFGIFIVDGILSASESFLLYGAVPMMSSIISSFISYVSMVKKKQMIVQFFDSIYTSLSTVFGTGSAAIRKEMKRLEYFVILGFVFTVVTQFGQRIAIIYEPQETNELLAKIANFTVVLHFDFLISSPVSWSFQWVLTHLRIFDIMALSLLLVLCQLMCLAFRHIHTLLNEPETNGVRSKYTNNEFYTLHREACSLVAQAENIFAPFLLTWSATQTLTACFWIRSLKIFYLHSAKFSTSILLSLLCTVIPFITLTVFVIKVNEEIKTILMKIPLLIYIKISNDDKTSKGHSQVVSTLKLFIQGIIQEKDTSKEGHSTHILYMTNHLMAPVSLTGCGFFTINKAFVLTIIGTVLTYTLVLYGID